MALADDMAVATAFAGRVEFDFPVVNQPLSQELALGLSGNRAFIDNGVTLVPLRFVSE